MSRQEVMGDQLYVTAAFLMHCGWLSCLAEGSPELEEQLMYLVWGESTDLPLHYVYLAQILDDLRCRYPDLAAGINDWSAQSLMSLRNAYAQQRTRVDKLAWIAGQYADCVGTWHAREHALNGVDRVSLHTAFAMQERAIVWGGQFPVRDSNALTRLGSWLCRAVGEVLRIGRSTMGDRMVTLGLRRDNAFEQSLPTWREFCSS